MNPHHKTMLDPMPGFIIFVMYFILYVAVGNLDTHAYYNP